MSTRTITCTLTTPVPSLAGTGTVYFEGVSAADYPKITASSTATSGPIPAVPMITASGTAVQGAMSHKNVPKIEATGVAASVVVSNPTCTSSAAVPAILADGAASQLVGQTGTSTGDVPSIEAYGVSAIVGTSQATLLQIIAAAQGHSGVIATSSVSLPLITATGFGEQPVVGTSTVLIPLIIAQGRGQQADSSNGGIVMHTERQALSTYTNYPFNSFARFNGVYLAAGDGGVFALSGATDDGAFIAAAARVGLTDFGSSHLKKVDRMYVGYRADGDMILRVFTNENDVRDYALKATGKTGLHGNHVRIGKGVQARYWQFEIQNKDGADFDLNVMECMPTRLRRRVGGGDA